MECLFRIYVASILYLSSKIYNKQNDQSKEPDLVLLSYKDSKKRLQHQQNKNKTSFASKLSLVKF